MKWLLSIILFCSFLKTAVAADLELSELRSGDVIFQTSNSKQSYAIMWASKSLYSHVGIVERDGTKTYVIEAISKVSRTPFDKWISRGRMNRYAVYRYSGLSAEKENAIIKNAKSLLGKGYDIYFTSKNQEIYCSELVSIAFQKSGIEIGKFEKVKNLDVDNMVVRKLVEKRWKRHPVCRKVKTFESCWQKILDDELVSPESLSKDSQLKELWSNYPI